MHGHAKEQHHGLGTQTYRKFPLYIARANRPYNLPPRYFSPRSSRPATPGQSLDGGVGADGQRGGGGGGGGFYGGGGGGSGQQGAGGGGGSSYADTSALSFAVVDESASGWTNGVGGIRIVEAGESWVEVEWDKVTDAAVRAEPTWYEVSVCVSVCDSRRLIFAVLYSVMNLTVRFV